MINLLEQLPVELVGTNVLVYLSLKDILLLEQACGSKKYHQLFLDIIPYKQFNMLYSLQKHVHGYKS